MAINRDQIDSESRSTLHNSRGIELAERGWLDEAIIEFHSAIKNTPHCAQSYDNLATAYADKGKLLEALDAYTKALALEPENPFALHNLGCFLSNHGKNLAIKCFKEAAKLEPELYEAHFNLGLCLASDGEHEKAVAQFQKALDCNEQDLESRLQIALSFAAINKHALAIKELLKVVKADDKNEQAWTYLGLSYQEQGFLEEAVNALAKAVKLGDSIDSMLHLASLLMRLEREKEARGLLKRAVQIDKKRATEFIAHDEYLELLKEKNNRRH